MPATSRRICSRAVWTDVPSLTLLGRVKSVEPSLSGGGAVSTPGGLSSSRPAKRSTEFDSWRSW